MADFKGQVDADAERADTKGGQERKNVRARLPRARKPFCSSLGRLQPLSYLLHSLSLNRPFLILLYRLEVKGTQRTASAAAAANSMVYVFGGTHHPIRSKEVNADNSSPLFPHVYFEGQTVPIICSLSGQNDL